MNIIFYRVLFSRIFASRINDTKLNELQYLKYITTYLQCERSHNLFAIKCKWLCISLLIMNNT